MVDEVRRRLGHGTREDVLAYHLFPRDHWQQFWSTNLQERVNVAPRDGLGSAMTKGRTDVVCLFPNDPAISLLWLAVLREQHEH